MRVKINKKRGFTLIELLVVISVIGLLSGIILTNLNEARNKAANAKIISLVEQYSKAFLLYETNHNGKLPPITIDPRGICLGYVDEESCTSYGSVAGNTYVHNLIAPYMGSMPKDGDITYYCQNVWTDDPVSDHPELASCDQQHPTNQPFTLVYRLKGNVTCPLKHSWQNNIRDPDNNTTICSKMLDLI